MGHGYVTLIRLCWRGGGNILGSGFFLAESFGCNELMLSDQEDEAMRRTRQTEEARDGKMKT